MLIRALQSYTQIPQQNTQNSLEREKETVKLDFVLGEGHELTPGKVQQEPDSNQDKQDKIKQAEFSPFKTIVTSNFFLLSWEYLEKSR